MAMRVALELKRMQIRLEFDKEPGFDRVFTVTYGKQVQEYLTYAEAARALGTCILHFLACEGRLHCGDAEDDEIIDEEEAN